MIEVTRTGDVHVLTMAAEENRFNPAMLAAFDAALTAVEQGEGPAAVVLTGQGKFFSNGLDLEWMMANAEQGGPAQVVDGLQALYRRLLTFPVATVAAMNGHAFAGGGMLALACDQRVMRTGRGFFCLPEVDINIPFTPGMSQLVQAKLTPAAAYETMLTGRRFSAEEALAAGIVDAAVPEEQVVPVAVERAQALAGKLRSTVATIKQRMYGEATAALAEAVDGLDAVS
jgi:enoyl-CoA hydratase/carnithine racemase